MTWGAIAKDTARAYSTGIQHHLTFVTLCGIAVPSGTLPDLNDLIKFLYLAGIRFHFLKAGHCNPFKEHDR
ncbi:hypothetical protein KUTeg_007601 [Tegillarca granosa]|uniref:Uncharacterized protein n=1 Tax=Tegillarca granosa TaxID=220873 RepID=A0ABQ9FFP7_TEGGR|nr:hypothetical protein KUTeg_007601 [Tegillarca granosa]